MMSAALEKTVEQTFAMLRGNLHLQSDVTSCLRKLESCLVTSSESSIQENRSIVFRCGETIKCKSQELHLNLTEKRECLVCIAYLNFLSESVDFVFPFVIRCIEDAKSPCDKSLGYQILILLNQSSSMNAYLAVNTLLKDINCKHDVVSCIAMTAGTFLLDIDLIPVFLPAVEKQLQNPNPRVRYKALILLQRMYRIAPEYLMSVWDHVLRAMCDRSPRVMSASLPLLHTLLLNSNIPSDRKLSEKVLFILNQVVKGSLPIDMMYGGFCGPWLQIKLVAIVRYMGLKRFSENQLVTLRDMFKSIFARFQRSERLQCAIVHECAATVIAFNPKLSDLDPLVSDTIESFLNSNEPNLLVTGIELLKLLVGVKPGYSKQYAEKLLKCLNDDNTHLVQTILYLIHDLTDSGNCKPVIARMTEQLHSVHDVTIKKALLREIMKLSQRYSLEDNWFLCNYSPLLATVENELDSDILMQFLKSIESSPAQSLQNEAKKLITEISQKYSPMQYCFALEIIGSTTEFLNQKECEEAIKNILKVLSSSKVNWDEALREEVSVLSWYTVLALSKNSESKIDIVCTANPSLAAKQTLFEIKQLLENKELCESLIFFRHNDIDNTIVDEDLSFLDDFVSSHSSSLTASDIPKLFPNLVHTNKSFHDPVPTTKQTQLKYEPYTNVTKSQKVGKDMEKSFLGKSEVGEVRRVWDESGYKEPMEHAGADK